MGKIEVNHRVVTRDQSGKIISDEEYVSFAVAKPFYDKATAKLESGHEVCLQHGARVIFRAT
jgi:hypothetical protein